MLQGTLRKFNCNCLTILGLDLKPFALKNGLESEPTFHLWMSIHLKVKVVHFALKVLIFVRLPGPNGFIAEVMTWKGGQTLPKPVAKAG